MGVTQRIVRQDCRLVLDRYQFAGITGKSLQCQAATPV
jgi:hypothetical protein